MLKREGQQVVEKDTVNRMRPWRYVLRWAIGGVACDWYCAFEWLRGESSFFSGSVFYRTVLIVMLCAFVAFLLVLVLGRADSRGVAAAFFLISFGFFGFMFIGHHGVILDRNSWRVG
jgi:hypothetical protein